MNQHFLCLSAALALSPLACANAQSLNRPSFASARASSEGAARTDAPAPGSPSPTPNQAQKHEPPTPREVELSFGPNAPILLGPIATRGHFTVYCSASNAPPSSATLHVGPDWVIPFAGFVANSYDERFIAIADESSVRIVDTSRKRIVDMTKAGLRLAPVTDTDKSRSLRFHPSEPKVAYVANRDGSDALVVLNLETDEERVIRPLSATIERIRWDASGDFLYLDESNAPNTKGPHASSRHRNPCHDETGPRFFVGSPRPRRFTSSVVTLKDGQVAPISGQQFSTKAGALLLSAEGRLSLAKGNSRASVLPSDCQATVLGMHPGSDTLVIGCTDRGHMNLWLVSGGKAIELKVEGPVAFDLSERLISKRLLPIYSGGKTSLIDFATQHAVSLTDRDQLLAQNPQFALIRRGKSLVRRNLDMGTDTLLDVELPTGARMLFAPGVVFAEPYVVSAAEGPAMKVAEPQLVVAISERGCLLYASRKAEKSGIVEGPLKWRCPFNDATYLKQ